MEIRLKKREGDERVRGGVGWVGGERVRVQGYVDTRSVLELCFLTSDYFATPLSPLSVFRTADYSYL